ncbi:MAG: hypothetical protein A2018_08035 [Alphaproteobacteria bacterium GWF2_58_20]|nr:MAG: hypothetical protein A2018_08035 [Alphaproteobacteria bacterium GWF2_58_20]
MHDILMQPDVHEERTLWVPLGGNNEDTIGGNSHAIIHEWVDENGEGHRQVVLVDAGNLFGRGGKHSEFLPVLDPFLTRREDEGKEFSPTHLHASAIFITHAHEDHIAALQHYINRGFKLPPIYCSKLTSQYVMDDLEELISDPDQWPEIHVMEPGERVQLGKFTTRAVPVSHSVSQSFAYQVKTPGSNLLFTGDFKIDQDLLLGPMTDLGMLAEIGREGVDAVMMDSTRADVPGFTMTEHAVRETFRRIMKQNPDKRFITAVMGRNTERVAGLVKVAAEMGRQIVHEGPALKKTLYLCKRAGIDLRSLHPDVKIHDGKSQLARKLAPSQMAGMITGTQAEINAALDLASRGDHRRLRLDPKTDILIISASLIPGNEARVHKLVADLRAQGFIVIVSRDEDVASSGHPAAEDCKLTAKTTNARMVIPVHGSIAHRTAQCRNMAEIGVPSLMVGNGNIVCFGGPQGTRIIGHRPHGLIGVQEKRVGYNSPDKNDPNAPKVQYAYEMIMQKPKPLAQPKPPAPKPPQPRYAPKDDPALL